MYSRGCDERDKQRRRAQDKLWGGPPTKADGRAAAREILLDALDGGPGYRCTLADLVRRLRAPTISFDARIEVRWSPARVRAGLGRLLREGLARTYARRRSGSPTPGTRRCRGSQRRLREDAEALEGRLPRVRAHEQARLPLPGSPHPARRPRAHRPERRVPHMHDRGAAWSASQ